MIILGNNYWYEQQNMIDCFCHLHCRYCKNITFTKSYYNISTTHRKCAHCKVYFGCVDKKYTYDKISLKIEYFVRKLNNKYYELKIEYFVRKLNNKYYELKIVNDKAILRYAPSQFREFDNISNITPDNVVSKIKMLLTFQ